MYIKATEIQLYFVFYVNYTSIKERANVEAKPKIAKSIKVVGYL